MFNSLTRLNKVLLYTVVIMAGLSISLSCLAGPYSPTYIDIDVNGDSRNFGYYIPPSYDSAIPTPLLFMFHGMTGNNSEASGGSAEMGYYDWQKTAEQNGFIVLFPEGIIDIPFPPYDTNLWDLDGDTDLKFMDNLVGWASSNYNIRTTHIFCTGHSYGGFFSYYLAKKRSSYITAFAEHSSGLQGIAVPSGPNPSPKLNAIILHATNDGMVAYSNSQDLYDELTNNNHNVYEDGVGADGIIEVDGWGPTNHRYRLVHNQTQWDFFMSCAPRDDDGDGIGDAWEAANGLDVGTLDASPDYDGDGRSNYEEYIANTDPADPASAFVIDVLSAEDKTFAWDTFNSRQYTLYYATNLTDPDPWSPVTQMTNLPGIDAAMGYTNPTPDANLFYKAVVTLAD